MPLPFVIGSVILAVLSSIAHCAYGVSLVALLMSIFSVVVLMAVIVTSMVFLTALANNVMVNVLVCFVAIGLVDLSVAVLNIVVLIIQCVYKAYAPVI